MNTTTSKTLKYTAVGLTGLIVSVIGLLLALVAFILASETGTRFALSEAEALKPQMLHIGTVDGSFLSPLTLRNVDYKTQTMRVHLAKATLKWSPGALFGGVVRINLLALDDVDYTAIPAKTPPKSKPFKLPKRLHLPMSLIVKQVSLRNLKYHSKPRAKPFVIDSLDLAAGVSNKNVYVKNLAIRSPKIDATGGLHTAPYGAYPTVSQLHFEYRKAQYAPIDGHMRLHGDLKQRLHLTQTIAAPYNIKAKVMLAQLFEQLHFNAALNIDGMHLRRIHGTLPAATLSAAANSQGSTKNLTYALKASVAQQKLQTLKAAFKGSLKAKIVTIKDLTLAIAQHPARLHGQGQVNIRKPKQPALDLHFNWAKLAYPLSGPAKFTSPKGRVDLTGTPKHLLAKLDVAVGDDGHVYGQARRLRKKFKLALNWRDLKWPMQKPARLTSPTGRMTFGGTMAHYALAVDAAVSAPKQTNGHVIVRGAGDKTSIDISRIDIKALDGTLNGTAEAAWKPATKGKIDLTGQGINPGVLNPKWPGSIALDLKASGAKHGKALHATIPTLKVNGKLRGYPVALNGVLDYAPAGLDLKTFTMRSGSTHLAANGHVGKKTLNLDWSLHSDDLASLLPHAAGRLNGHGQVSGPLKRPQVVATLAGNGIQYSTYKLAKLNLDANLDLQGQKRSRLNFTLAKGTVGSVKIKQVALKGHGTPSSHTLTMSAATSKGNANIGLDGDFKNATEDFTLKQARLKYPKLKAWTLAAPGSGYIKKGEFALSKTCWQAAPARLCLNAKRSTKLLTAAFTLKKLRYSYLASLLPHSIKVRGGLSASGQVRKPTNGVMAAKFALNTTAGRIATTAESAISSNHGKPVTVLRLKPSQVRLDLGKQGLDMNAALNLAHHNGMTMTARVPGGTAPFSQRPINAHLKAQVKHLGFLAKLSPMVKSLRGRLNGHLNISGRVKEPQLKGRIALTKGAAVLPGPGLDMRHIRFAVIGQNNGGLALNGHAESGGGFMNIGGKANFLGKTKKFRLNINGKNFLGADNATAHVLISPALKIALNGSKINVGGKVVVPKANITPKKIPQGAVGVSSDQVIVKPGTKRKTAVKKSVNAKIRLILGNDVHFAGFGAKAQLKGNLLVLEQQGQPVKGNGEFDIVSGEYRAYGQGLVIDSGELLWSGGPIAEPAVNIRAVRHPGKTSTGDDVTVGVHIEGTLKKPEFTVFSSPDMSQSEQLSWLVLGQPLKSTSGGQSNMLADAALGLGITGGNELTKSIKKGVGLDTLAIKTGSGEAGAPSNNKQASLVVGKYLTPKLYVSYGYGLFQPISTITLQYLLSSKWKISTESSRQATGGDIEYTVESGRGGNSTISH